MSLANKSSIQEIPFCGRGFPMCHQISMHINISSDNQYITMPGGGASSNKRGECLMMTGN